jgi:hypothetical protein
MSFSAISGAVPFVQTFPQPVKPCYADEVYGTAEAVPFVQSFPQFVKACYADEVATQAEARPSARAEGAYE